MRLAFTFIYAEISRSDAAASTSEACEQEPNTHRTVTRCSRPAAKRSADVAGFQIRKVIEDLLFGHPGCEVVQNVGDGEAQIAN